MIASPAALRQLLIEVEQGHTTVEEAAVRIEAHIAMALEEALQHRGIGPIPNAEQRLMRDMKKFSGQA